MKKERVNPKTSQPFKKLRQEVQPIEHGERRTGEHKGRDVVWCHWPVLEGIWGYIAEKGRKDLSPYGNSQGGHAKGNKSMRTNRDAALNSHR